MAISSSDSSFSSTGVVRSGSTERTSESIILSRTDMLDCRVCSQPLTIPVYQCFKGHMTCSRCRGNYQHTCCICYFPTEHIRNYGLEAVLEAAKITCSNNKYGCKEKVRYIMKLEHMRSCAYEPCYCPFPGCGFDGSYKDLYLHFAREHLASAIRFKFDTSFSVHMGANMKYKFLQENDNTLFIINYGVLDNGDVIVSNIICMGPSCLENEYSHELEASSGNSSVKFTYSSTQSQRKWEPCVPEKSLLVVTKHMIDSHKIRVCIRRKGEN
ncbi:RING-type E3 ubiquitin transferase [Heracleum sosnowskyi]|uniref:RING-type E3 ubiquitin transferase n=1 Tax=Heracleum sosnowskyi TaxID=360622 RepID=A0AAD8GNL1_9APIA|nr:RING-type E3 ubiquitin transferase [Heracleum sosnowskyi]